VCMCGNAANRETHVLQRQQDAVKDTHQTFRDSFLTHPYLHIHTADQEFGQI